MLPFSVRRKPPLYEKVATQLISEISSGKWPPGARLPNEEGLQKRFGVSRVTLRQAMSLLEKNKLIKRYRRRGSFIVDDPLPLLASPGAGKVVQFLHLGFEKSQAESFSKWEVEAAERFFSRKEMTMAWSTMQSSDLMSGQLPAAIRQGLCSGLLVDGYVLEPHMEFLAQVGLPTVLLGSHPVSARWHQVTYDPVVAAALCMEAMREVNVEELVFIDGTKRNHFAQMVLRQLLYLLEKARLPPVRILPEEFAASGGLCATLDRIGPRCAVVLFDGLLPDVVRALDREDPSWSRHSLIVLGLFSPGARRLADRVIEIAISPAALATRAAELFASMLEGKAPAPGPIFLPIEKKTPATLKMDSPAASLLSV